MKNTLMSLFRAAFEFKNAKSMAAWSIRARFVASGKRTSSAVKSWEGPWGASWDDMGGVEALGVPGVGVGNL